MRPDTIFVLVLVLVCVGAIVAMSVKSHRNPRPEANDAATGREQGRAADSGLPPQGDPRR